MVSILFTMYINIYIYTSSLPFRGQLLSLEALHPAARRRHQRDHAPPRGLAPLDRRPAAALHGAGARRLAPESGAAGRAAEAGGGES